MVSSLAIAPFAIAVIVYLALQVYNDIKKQENKDLVHIIVLGFMVLMVYIGSAISLEIAETISFSNQEVFLSMYKIATITLQLAAYGFFIYLIIYLALIKLIYGGMKEFFKKRRRKSRHGAQV